MRSSAWICDFSSTHNTIALSGGAIYRPTMSRTFSTKSGSLDSLKVPVRCGCRPKARQIRVIAVCESPLALAIERVLQCVAPRGVCSSVIVITRSTSSSPILRGAPGRGSSSRPSTRRSTNRLRQLPTVTRWTPSRSATSPLVSPSAQARTMRARCARPCAVFRRRAHACSVSRSACVSTKAALGRPCAIARLLPDIGDEATAPYSQLTSDSEH